MNETQPTSENIIEANESNRIHIDLVRRYLRIAATELLVRGEQHDQSKFSDVERNTFATYTPKLKSMVYGSPEYKQCLEAMAPALKHHYANNRHHPEHYEEGLLGMSLFDLLEMFLDWSASCKRSPNGNIRKSIEINKSRFKMSDDLVRIFENTATEWETLNGEQTP